MARRPRGKFTLSGDAQLRANMKRLSKIYDGPAMDADMETALEPLRNRTQQNAVPTRNFVGKHSAFFPQPHGVPKGGHLDEGVVSRKVEGTAKRRVWWVSFAKRARFIAHLVEFGTAPHFQQNFKGGFHHPGARPHPFFRPAFEGEKSNVLERLGRSAKARIAAVLAGVKVR